MHILTCIFLFQTFLLILRVPGISGQRRKTYFISASSTGRRVGGRSTLKDDADDITKLKDEVGQLKANVESLIQENKNLAKTKQRLEEMQKISDTIPSASEEDKLTDDWRKLVNIIRKLDGEKKRNIEARRGGGGTGGPDTTKGIARDEDDVALRSERENLEKEKRQHEIARVALDAEKRELEKENKKKELVAEKEKIDADIATKKEIFVMVKSAHDTFAALDPSKTTEIAKSKEYVDIVQKEIEDMQFKLLEVKSTLNKLEKKS